MLKFKKCVYKSTFKVVIAVVKVCNKVHNTFVNLGSALTNKFINLQDSIAKSYDMRILKLEQARTAIKEYQDTLATDKDAELVKYKKEVGSLCGELAEIRSTK